MEMFNNLESLENAPLGFAVFIDLFQCTDQKPPPSSILYEPFQLPMMYLDASNIHPLSPIVSADLELVWSPDSSGMYHHLFQPEHQFAKDMIQEWGKCYTTDVDFLKDSQAVITDMVKYEYKMESGKLEVGKTNVGKTNVGKTNVGKLDADSEPVYRFDDEKCKNITAIWNSVKEDDSFLERYSFIEWDFLKSFNRSEPFLQILSVMNLSSPVMSLLIPFLFLIFPFLILMIQRIPITFEVYISTLREIARNHFIGKTLFQLQNITLERALYMVVTFGLYIMQIYQNIAICRRFYRNIQKINEHLCELRDYIAYSIESMETFCSIHVDKVSYTPFLEETRIHSSRLRAFHEMLIPIAPFQYTFAKVGEFGYLLKCVYEFYSNEDYDESIRYSIGFEGFVNNMRGVHRHLQQGHIATSQLEEDISGNSLVMNAQYYPPAVGEDPVKNRCDLTKNAIITGPNASGKTTFLKTTTINIIFTQQVGCGFYRSCTMKPYTHIHSYLNIPDTSGRDSLFQAESRRCKEIIDIILANQDAGAHHFCIFDELYSGTNPTEATKSAYSFLKYLGGFQNVDFMLTTHYLSVCRRFRHSDVIQNYKMDATIDEETGKITYNYKIKRGISKIQGAIKILEEMDYPKEILDSIQNYGKET